MDGPRKVDELRKNVVGVVMAQIVNPTVPAQRDHHRLVLSSGMIEQVQESKPKRATTQLRAMLEACLLAIANDDRCRGGEESFDLVIAWRARANPGPLWMPPSEP